MALVHAVAKRAPVVRNCAIRTQQWKRASHASGPGPSHFRNYDEQFPELPNSKKSRPGLAMLANFR